MTAKKKNRIHLLKALRNYLNRLYPPPSQAMIPAPGVVGQVKNDVIDEARERVYVRVAPSVRCQDIVEAVRTVLERKMVSFVRGRLRDDFLPAFIFSEQDYEAAIAAISEVDLKSFLVEIYCNGNIVSLEDARHMVSSKELALFVHVERKVAGDRDIISYFPIDLLFATTSANKTQESMLLITTVNPYVRRLRSQSFQTLSARSADISENTQLSMASPSFPVDVVYTWVDDQDEEWRRERAHFSRDATDTSSNADNRFKSRDEIRYSLRSIEMFAPFVRNVYIVANGTFPSWLNRSNNRLICVSHRDIYQDQSVLPTFNSNSIETQLHHIDGLSEHYIYMNDDVFLGTFSKAEDFFLSNGCMKFYPSEHRMFPMDTRLNPRDWLYANLSAVEMLERAGIPTSRFVIKHTPLPARRSISYALESKFPLEWSRCASNRFRGERDINPLAFLAYQYGFSIGLAVPSEMESVYISLDSPYVKSQFQKLLSSRNCQSFCINDTGVPSENEAMINRHLQTFLEEYFPFKSSFEV
jgi:hypothetical protein